MTNTVKTPPKKKEKDDNTGPQLAELPICNACIPLKIYKYPTLVFVHIFRKEISK
jgi:hypothetical protein